MSTVKWFPYEQAGWHRGETFTIDSTINVESTTHIVLTCPECGKDHMVKLTGFKTTLPCGAVVALLAKVTMKH